MPTLDTQLVQRRNEIADAIAGYGIVDAQPLDGDLTTWAAITPASGVGTFLATPTSANLLAAITNETGTGALVFATSPTLVTPALGVATATSLGVGMTAAALVDVNGVIRSTGNAGTPASGAGVELVYSGGTGYFQAYDRTGAAYRPFNLEASILKLNPNSAGNTGVGNFAATNPTNILHIVGLSATPSLRIGGSSNLLYYWDIGRENVTTGDFLFMSAEGGAASEIARFTVAGNGKLGIGTGATISARLHATSTTEQLRLGYNASNYYSTTVSSTGGITFDAVGSGAGFTFADRIINSVPMRLKAYTVATLPSGTQGDTAFVTDALAPTFLATVVDGGAVVTPVFYNGTSWVGY